ncbi:alpha/beta hydrolase [Nocardioides gilvus]|uniref:alpha/beta hydrolase n=1 Tax=Nocardioides gilvus TaxID=1735589 RepID=UPI000D74EBC4|nr:alpha/beta hydrolase [Nocardioides gilvus]
MRVLFIHGAGGYLEDQEIAATLRTHLQAPVEMPQMPDEDMSVEAWATIVRHHLTGLGEDDVVIGHSFGATILEWVLGEKTWAPHRALLLAMPDWSPDGWDVADYAHPGPGPQMSIALHHCQDDEVVSFEHLALNAARLPSATVVEHQRGGHQFEGVDLGP